LFGHFLGILKRLSTKPGGKKEKKNKSDIFYTFI